MERNMNSASSSIRRRSSMSYSLGNRTAPQTCGADFFIAASDFRSNRGTHPQPGDQNVYPPVPEYVPAPFPGTRHLDRDVARSAHPTHLRWQRCAQPAEFPPLSSPADSLSHPSARDGNREYPALEQDRKQRKDSSGRKQDAYA